MIYLKQSTASQEIPLGYLLDSTDGNTEETGLTIANTDIKIWKTGATTLANKNSGGATHISNGIYYAVLDATDTNTLGSLVIFVHVSGSLAVRLECVVLTANIYDSLIAGTDNQTVDLIQIGGDTQSATDLKDFADAGYDPATNKVQGVVLVDTTTTNTDMAGTNNALLAASVNVSAGIVEANVKQVSDDTTAANNLELDYDGTGYAKANSTIGTTTTNTDMRGTDSANTVTPPTVAELNARTILSASYFDPAVDAVANVTLVDTTTTNTDMRGTDSAALASVCTNTRLAELDAANLPADIDNILTDTGTTLPASIAALNDITVADIIAGITDGTYNLTEIVTIAMAVLSGKSSGGGSTSLVFRDTGDSKDVVTATVDTDGNRTAVTRNP